MLCFMFFTEELPAEAHVTAMFAEKFDNSFDAVNADTVDLRRGKKYSTNISKDYSPHLELFAQMRKFIFMMQYLGSKSKPPSQDGWIHTLNAIEKLWKNLQGMNIERLFTRRLNQDPLENCFGCIRYSCGSNTNPTIAQFVAGIKTAIITNLRHSGQKKNCQDDSAILCNNLSHFLTADISNNAHLDRIDFEAEQLQSDISDAAEAIEQGTPEGQACGYVCGFIFKKSNYKDCPDCRRAFLTDSPETIHIFTSFREYDSVHNSLNYVNKNVVQCVETSATIINKYLKTDAYKDNVRENIITLLNNVDFSFLDVCKPHLVYNIKHIKTCTFFICIKRYTILKIESLTKKKNVREWREK